MIFYCEVLNDLFERLENLFFSGGDLGEDVKDSTSCLENWP